MGLADFHIHSTYSDGKMSIAEIVDFYGQHGFTAIAITDHLCESSSVVGKVTYCLRKSLTFASFPQYIAEIKKEARRALQRYGMLVIPGVEFTKNYVSNRRSAHFLGLGIDRYICPNQDTVTILKKIKALGGLTIAAHPVNTGRVEHQTYFLWDRRDELSRYFDAWEVASGPEIFAEVAASGLPVIANSDLHRPSQITSWKTVLNQEKSIDSVLQAIRQQNLGVHFFERFSSEFLPQRFQTNASVLAKYSRRAYAQGNLLSPYKCASSQLGCCVKGAIPF